MIIIEVYVDDIILKSDDERMSQKLSKDMRNEFEMFVIGELTFFLGLQISQLEKGIFISQKKYIGELLYRFGMKYCNFVSTPMEKNMKVSSNEGNTFEDPTKYR